MQAVSSTKNYSKSGAGNRRPEGARYDGTAALAYSRESVAYDLSRFDQRSRVRRAVSEEQTTEKARPRAATAAKTVPAARISPFSVLSFFVVCSLLFMIVYSYVQLNELSTSKSDLQDAIAQEKDDYAVMQAELERKISLTELETIATTRLGMIKAQQEQIRYADLSGEDYAVVLAQQAPSESGFAAAVAGLFDRFLEYLR